MTVLLNFGNYAIGKLVNAAKTAGLPGKIRPTPEGKPAIPFGGRRIRCLKIA